MKTLAKQIKETVKKEIELGGFSGAYKVEETSETPHILGRIDILKLGSIVISYNPDYDSERLRLMARDVTRHEQNHRAYRGFNGCPRNIEYHTERFMEPMAKILMKKGFNEEDVHYIANTLQDSILHTDLNSAFSLEGISELFSDVGKSSEIGFTSFYDAHVKLNMFLWGNKKQKRQQKPYAVKDKEKQKKIAEVVQNFLRRTGIGDLEQEVTIGGKPVKVKDKERIREFLNNEANWENISQIYAEEFSKLIEPSYALPIFNHSGRGTKGRESEAPLPSDGNEFDKAMKGEDYKMKRVWRAYTNSKETPPFIETYEAMDMVYQMLARKLNIKVQAFTESEQRPVAWFGRKDFDPEKDKPRHLTFGFDDKGDLVLKIKPHYTTINIPHKQNPRGFPEARFCLLDTSQSMKYNPDNEGFPGEPRNIGKTSIIPWGDNSKYHYLQLSWYGILEYLKQNHLLSQMTISLGNFSGETIMARGLQEAKKNALRPQWQETEIDESKISEIFSEQGNLIWTISDGDVQNWSDIRNDFIGAAKRHCYFHLQIGDETEMSRELREKGFKVVIIKRAADLAQKVIDVTGSVYRGGLN